MCDDRRGGTTPTRTIVRLLLGLPIPLLLALGGAAAIDAATPGAPVYVLPTTGIVDNVMAGYIEEGVARADRDGSPAVVIRLDTPGGSLEATNRIVSTLLESRVPTIVWVAPAGARAASAGTFITLAANLAYMAPGTNIGAASPVGSGGEDIEGTLGEKVKNDTIAKIRAIAETRDRNVDWAVATVEEARSSPANEAVEVGAVDAVAASLDEIAGLANGREVQVRGGPVTLDLTGAAFEDLPMNPFQSLLHLLADPNIAFILFTVGFYGLIFELQNPNFVTGILGALAIVLAFVGFGSLPLNVAGLLLIGFAIILFILEATVTSHGLLTVGGLVCFLLGASALYTAPGDPTAPDVAVALPLIATMAILTTAFFGLIAVTAIRSRRMIDSPALVGAPDGVVGAMGKVSAALLPVGTVHAAGEEWTARAVDDRPVERGTPVRVVRRDGLVVLVEPVDEGFAGTTGGATSSLRQLHS